MASEVSADRVKLWVARLEYCFDKVLLNVFEILCPIDYFFKRPASRVRPEQISSGNLALGRVHKARVT